MAQATTFKNGIRVQTRDSAPSSPEVGQIAVVSGKMQVYQDTGWSRIDGTAAGSLDAAYNGGATITVDNGAFTLTDSQTDTTNGLLLTKSGAVTGSDDCDVLYVNSTGNHDTSGRVSLIHLDVATESAGTPEGVRVDMNTNTDNALKITKGAITLDDGGVTLASGALSVGGNLTATGTAALATVTVSTSVTSEGPIVIDVDNAEAFLIRENGDASDVVTVDTTQDAGDTTFKVSSKTTTGLALHVDSDTTTGAAVLIDADAVTTGDALRISIASGTMGATGAAISVIDSTNADREVFAVRDDGSVYMYGTAEGTTVTQTVAGDVLITDGDLTLSGGEVNVTDGVTTTGSGIKLTSSMTTAGASAGAAGALTVIADSATTGTVVAIRADAITTGDMLYLDNGGATLTTGYFINANDDDTSVFTVGANGATIIAGSASGTDALTVTAGDISLSAGSLEVIDTTADQFGVKYDASNHFVVAVASDGGTTLTTTGTDADFEIATGTTGDITLDSTGDIILEAGGGDVTMDAQLTITNTDSDQFVIAYDGSNTFGFDVDSDGSTTLTTTGTDADFEIATGTGGDITLDATGDIILEAGGSDINANAPLNITVAAGSQIELIASGSIKAVHSVADTTGNYTITSSGGTGNIIELVGDKLVFDSAGDIDIEAGGNDINMDSPLNITDAAGSQLELIASGSIKAVHTVADTTGVASLTVSGGTTNSFEVVADAITLDSAGALALESTGVTSDAAITVTTTGGTPLSLKYDGSNHLAVAVASDGGTTLTTTGTDADFEIATGTTGDITLDATGDIVLEAGGADITMDAQLTITNAAQEAGLVITNNAQTTADGVDISSTSITTGALMKLNANSATHDGEILELISAGGATNTPKGLNVVIASVTTGAAFGIDVTMAGATTTAKGIAVTMDALTEGSMLYLDNGGGSLTTGTYINCNDDGVSHFSVGAAGATVIAGSAAGTDALTVTAGDLLLNDSDENIIESEDGILNLLLLDNKAGAVGAGKAVLKVDAGGAVDAAGFGIDARFTGAATAGATVVNVVPVADTIGIKVNGGGVDSYEALYLDADSTTNSIAYMHTDAALAADKAVLELHANGSSGNADSSVLRIHQDATDGVSMLVTMVQDDASEPYINFEGATAADYTAPISTEQGDGAVSGPQVFSASNGWQWTGMVKCAVNGVDAWLPYYIEDTA